MELKFNIPDYLSIKDWKYLNSLEIEDETEKMLKFISHTTDIPEDTIMSLKPSDLTEVYSTILNQLSDVSPSFYPIIEINNQLYGYSSISKMTLAEYVDLKRLAKNPTANIEEMMAILYRPIEKHSFDGIVWAIKSQFKIGTGNIENLFNYYTLEKYDSATRAQRTEIMKELPVAFALGALSFFLVLKNTQLVSTNLSLNPKIKKEMEMIKTLSKAGSAHIGDGLLQFITSQKLPSFQLPAIKLSLT